MGIRLGIAAALAAGLGVAGLASAQSPPEGDSLFASQLWDVLVTERLVGPEALGAVPYLRNGEAHGARLVTFLSTILIDGVETPILVKRSYEGEEATRETIIANPTENLANVTVMVKREAGYDPANQDWFWAMYAPDGMVGQMEGNTMAGRVGMCSGCHATAAGGDYIFLHD